MRLSGLPDGAIERHWTRFQFDGQQELFRVKYFTFGDERKPTLVFWQGQNGAALLGCLMFKALAENFRVIALDCFSRGANTRLEQCSGLESAEKAEES